VDKKRFSHTCRKTSFIHYLSVMPITQIKDQTSKLKALYWDTDVDPEQLSRLFSGAIERIGHIDRTNLYRRLLMTYDWYTILSIIPQERLQEALSNPVIDHLYPESLKNRYLYARSVLFENDVAFTLGIFRRRHFSPASTTGEISCRTNCAPFPGKNQRTWPIFFLLPGAFLLIGPRFSAKPGRRTFG